MASSEVIPVETEKRGAYDREMGCNPSKAPEAIDYGDVKGPLTSKEEEDQDLEEKSLKLEDTSLEGMKTPGLGGHTESSLYTCQTEEEWLEEMNSNLLKRAERYSERLTRNFKKNVPPFNPSYPSPKPPDDTKEELCGHEDFTPIDKNAKSVPAKDKERYQTLLPRLLQGTNNDVQKVRAIYTYTGSINYNDPQVTQAKEGDTPPYYIKMIKEKKGDLPTFFAILCRRAGIPCVILNGLGKGKNYVPGMNEKDMRSKWNAVHVNDNWRPVHVEWGHQDNDGKKKDKNDDFYFLTDPDLFVVSCFPDDYQWQLLAEPLTKNEWLNLPNFRPAFFDLHMQLVKPKSGLVRAVKGKAEIEISVPKNIMDQMRVGYGLQHKGAISKKDRDKNNSSREMDSNRAIDSSRGMDSSLREEEKYERPKSVPPRLERYVFLNRKPSRLYYLLTLPVAGKYIFEIFGDRMEEEERDNNYGAAKTLLCQFRVLSETDPYDDDCEPLPDVPEFGWGPTPYCTRLGITPITHLEGIIYINPKEKKDIKFRVSEDLDFKTSLCHNYLPQDQLKDTSSWRQPKDDEMIVTVEIPEEGVFGLKVEAARADSGQFFEIANYLLRQHSRGGVSEKIRSKMLRARLNNAIEKGPTEKALRDAMDMFDCYNVPDQGEMARAQERLEQYWTIKRELNQSIRRRNNGVLDKWIKVGHSSKFEPELEEDIREAEEMKGKLGKLHGYLHPIAKMQPKTIQEIRTYKHPKPVTKNVMTATYILLGEKKEGLEDWSNIQTLMAKTGKGGLQKRILDRRPDEVNENDVELADVMLEPHNINEAREASAGTATFYRWAKEFIHHTRSPDNSYHKEDILDKETYRETYGISPNRHHDHTESPRRKYDSLNTNRSPGRKQDTKDHQSRTPRHYNQTEKPSHRDPKEQNEEPNTQHDLENSSAPKETQYQSQSPRRFERKVAPEDGKPEKRDKSLDNTGNQKQYPKKEKPSTEDKQQPKGEHVKHRDEIPERKDEVTLKKINNDSQKEKDKLQQKPIVPAEQRDEKKKPIQESNRKDREAKPGEKNDVVEEKQEENRKRDKDDSQKKEVKKLKTDRSEQDKPKNEEQETKNKDAKKRKNDEREEREEKVKKEIKEKESEKKEKEMIDKERQKMEEKEKEDKPKKEKKEKERVDLEEREKNKRGKKEKEQEQRQKEKEDRLKREKEEKERKEKEKQELEKEDKIKKENEEKERKQKEHQKREKEEQLKREKEEHERKEKEGRQKKNKEKKDKVEKEEPNRKEKEQNQKKEKKEPDKRAIEEKERKDKEEKQKKEEEERDKKEKEEKERKEKQLKEKEEKDKREKEENERKEREKKVKEKEERDKKEKEEKERKEKEAKQKKEKEERDKKEKEEKERKEKEKPQKEKEEKDKGEKNENEMKEKEKKEKEKEEREKKDKEEKERKEKEAKQKKEKEDTERKEKRDKERQQKDEKEKREREENEKKEKNSKKEKDQPSPIRSDSFYFFNIY